MKALAYIISAAFFTSAPPTNAVADVSANVLLALISTGMLWLVAGLLLDE